MMLGTSTFSRIRRGVPVAIALSAAALALGACGDDTSSGTGGGGNGVDLAFVQQMAPHHEQAIAMAKIALRRSHRSEIKQLARDIIKSQTAEITHMGRIASALKHDGTRAAHLGMEGHYMSGTKDPSELRGARAFDRAFIDMMVPHHQGAITMARAVLSGGESPAVDVLAQAVVDAQSREIAKMNMWRTHWYGAPSPTGGVPAAPMG
jgi:uncharacterized protein (DUF305 family)